MNKTKTITKEELINHVETLTEKCARLTEELIEARMEACEAEVYRSGSRQSPYTQMKKYAKKKGWKLPFDDYEMP